MIAMIAAGLMLYVRNPFVVLLVAAIAGVLLYYRFFQKQSKLLAETSQMEKRDNVYCGSRVWLLAGFGAITAISIQLAPLPAVLTKLWWVFFEWAQFYLAVG